MSSCIYNTDDDDLLLNDDDYQLFYDNTNYSDTEDNIIFEPIIIEKYEEIHLNDLINELHQLIHNIFDIYDRDGDHYISKDEYIFIHRTLAKVWHTQRLTEEQIYAKFLYLDKKKMINYVMMNLFILN